MVTMNVSLPALMKDWVLEKTEDGRYSNASDYVRDLIRRDQERAAKVSAMQKHVDEGLASGINVRSMDDVLKEARLKAKHLSQASK